MLNKLSFNLMNELNESETESYKIKKKVIVESNRVKTEDCNVELNNSEEPKHETLNEGNSDAVDRLFSGNELYFRDADGTAIMIHYADNYPQPEEYDEGYKTELGGSEEALNAAQQAAENGDVWELVEVDNEGNSTETIYGYAYGIDELKEYLKDLREVKVKKSLEENMIDDNIEDARQDSIEKGLTSESEETDLDEPNEDDNKNILQAKKDELEARLGEILMSIKDKQMDTEEFRALSREAAEIDSQITDLDNQINGLYESEIDNIIADKGILPEIKKFDDKIIRDAFLNMCELQQISVENQTQVLQECRRLSGEEPLTESGEEPNEEVKKDNENNKPITEANVSKKVMLKNQGNVYMFECKGNKDFTHIVGENYNESENLLENVETYTSKEEADKDYLKRCGLTEGYTSKDLAKDRGKYKKIDLYVDGKYETSTNSYKTVKEAIAALKNKDEYKDKKVTGEFSKQ